MGLFNKKKSPVASAFDDKLDTDNEYDRVLEYLIGLSAKDFDRVIKVAGIFRKANTDAASVLGIKDKPTTSIPSSKAVIGGSSADPLDFLPLEDEPVSKPKTTIKVTNPK